MFVFRNLFLAGGICPATIRSLFHLRRFGARAVDECSGHSLLECAVFECRELMPELVEITLYVSLKPEAPAVLAQTNGGKKI